MYYLTDDPTILAVSLGVAAILCLVALRFTQRGKFFVWALAFGLSAGMLVLFERLWVTDNERVEAVVYELKDAVARSDSDAVFALMTPDIVLEPRFPGGRGLLAREFIRSQLSQTKFDFLALQRLTVEVGHQSRRGSAQFEIVGSGSWQSYNWATRPGDAQWSVGVQEQPDKSWKINRLTAVRLPRPIKTALGISNE